jgi:DtxR family Mn-dependent transcriptional regulator
MGLKPDVSAALQDYLEAILDLSGDKGTARVTDIANSLNNSKASVHEALESLEIHGLVKTSKYGPVRLTQQGLDEARRIRKSHDALKTLLMDIMGVREETAEIDACAMEHALSHETLRRLIAFVESFPSVH